MTGDQSKVPATRGLILKESTIFERSSVGRPGFALPALDVPAVQPSKYSRQKPAELPEVGELDVVRHYTRLSSWNYAIDLGMVPLGSCTMKYNPRINEEIAAYPGLSQIHPETPVHLSQGALEVLHRLEKILCAVSGLDACSLQPAAGAHGEFTGLSMIHAFHSEHGSRRKYVLIPDSAHGTNPASCKLAGYEAVTIECANTSGVLTVDAVTPYLEKYGREIAALMVTNPNTLGFFETHIQEIAELLHGIGAQLYMDGANMNALLDVARPGDMGVDVMQFNLHKTFSTPHGGGGPGSGPVAVRNHLIPYLPNPQICFEEGKYFLRESSKSIGKVKGAFGNFGMAVRALCYSLHNGRNGLKQVSRAAVLNANYVRAKLSKYFESRSGTSSFHECVLSDKRQNARGFTTLTIAKALIDKGFHPPTIYFPLVVPGAMLIEPTETESLQELDQLVNAFTEIALSIEAGDKTLEQSPVTSVVGKVDEALAARKPVLSLDDRT